MALKYFLHSHGICESSLVGEGTRIWAFSHVLPGAVVGRDCNICDNVFIENDVFIGDRVTIKCHVALWDGLRVGDDVFIGPGVSFTNDVFPRSKKHNKPPMQTIIRHGATIGAGAVILPGLTIGEFAFVAAGAVVTRDVAQFTLVKGNPAKAAAQVCVCGAPLVPAEGGLRCTVGDWKGTLPDCGMVCNKC